MNLRKEHKPLFCCILAAAFILIFSCSKTEKTVRIWTDRAEFAEYAELFNSSDSDLKVIIQYRSNIAQSLPPAQDEQIPDIIIGEGFTANQVEKYFLPLDYLFSDMHMSQQQFYPQLLSSGILNGKQYLLPVSFNLPLVIFSDEKEKLIPDQYIIDTDQIRDISAEFNRKNKKGSYTSMGFAPSWNADFLYAVTKLKGVNFTMEADEFTWNEQKLNDTLQYLRSWTEEKNSSPSAEYDYKYKYLYTTETKWITEEHCTFAFSTSSTLFRMEEESLAGIDFRWLAEDGLIPMEDTILYMGLYKESKKLKTAQNFLIWFMKEDSQKKMLEWSRNMNLTIKDFGIAGGFSSVRNVNELYFPIYYPLLLGNLPQKDSLKSNENLLPERWRSLREKVILPYLSDSAKVQESDSYSSSLKDLYAIWKRQYY
ncbi:MAG: hypothetical protein K5930_00800 [Treponemataceae bacterium]|nr:hypothetical protein [Treponemataceae bacterium]